MVDVRLEFCGGSCADAKEIKKLVFNKWYHTTGHRSNKINYDGLFRSERLRQEEICDWLHRRLACLFVRMSVLLTEFNEFGSENSTKAIL